jgi:hypothetical protein
MNPSETLYHLMNINYKGEVKDDRKRVVITKSTPKHGTLYSFA